MAASRTLYVGGLAEEVSPDLLSGAFVPFGEVKECKLKEVGLSTMTCPQSEMG